MTIPISVDSISDMFYYDLKTGEFYVYDSGNYQKIILCVEGFYNTADKKFYSDK